MSLSIRFGYLVLFLLSFHLKANDERLIVDLNQDWKFSLMGDERAISSDFNDSQWDVVDIPHDWAFEKGISKNGMQADKGGYFDGGLGWYRRSFNVESNWLNKRVLINFDGVYMNSEVWINGHYIDKRAYGYISFRYDISKHLNVGENQISVKVDNLKEPSARWYHPAGIYAPVSLEITDAKSYVTSNGVFITTDVKNKSFAMTNVQIEYTNTRDEQLYLESTVIDQSGREISSSKQPLSQCNSNSCSLNTKISIDNPQLWDVDTPYLYSLSTTISSDSKVYDKVVNNFGVRTIKWDAETGFWINNKNTKLKGVSEHWEGGPVGGAWTKSLLRWKLALFKEMGVNAIRTAHNPYPPIFYELCDELGILVMDEIFDGWDRKAPFDYGQQAFADDWKMDLTEWVKRNRNHPSIIIYSVGNETGYNKEYGLKIGQELVDAVHELDSTRPVTSGHSASSKMDVYGVNGGSEKMQFFDAKHPNKPFVATEAPHTWQTRGYYRSKTWLRDGNHSKKQGVFPLPDLTDEEIFTYEWADPSQWKNHKQHFNSSYDNATVRISARKNWELMRDLPWFSGHFRWTGFDYYGEAGYVHGGWPFRLFMGGALDVAGFEKDLFYFYKSQWVDEPFVHLLPHWTHPRMVEGTKIPVWAYSNCDEVELYLNGESLGKDNLGTKWDEMQAEWMVPWEEGLLFAECIVDGSVKAITQQITAQHPSKLRTNLEDKHINLQSGSAVVTASLHDKQGIYYPYGENKVYFHLIGEGRIRSLENGDPVDTSKNVGINNRKAFMGATRAFIDIPTTEQNLTLISAAIIGDKHLYISDMVSIDVQLLNLLGKAYKANVEVFYTTNGDKPTRNSEKYSGAFRVKENTEVQAIVYVNGEQIFDMSESFADGSGLYWGTGENTTQTNELSAMPAKDATLKGAVKRSNYVDFQTGEGSITWYQENDGEYGLNELTFEYATNDKRQSRDMLLVVNDKVIKTLKFSRTGSWTNKWKKVTVVAPLGAGANYIELRTKGMSGPNIKSLSITPKGQK